MTGKPPPRADTPFDIAPPRAGRRPTADRPWICRDSARGHLAGLVGIALIGIAAATLFFLLFVEIAPRIAARLAGAAL